MKATIENEFVSQSFCSVIVGLKCACVINFTIPVLQKRIPVVIMIKYNFNSFNIVD